VLHGATRKGDHIIEDQTRNVVSKNTDALSGMRRQKELAVEMKEALVRGHLTRFGELMGEAWFEKKRMSDRITTPAIDEAYEAARQAGALGGKVTGAGGGGFMLFYCRPGRRHSVEEALTRLEFHPAEFAFDNEGVRTWSYVEPR
jgi:D-glycero-alpha-D-manno-heptose-7-phosphate kinase